MFFAANQIISTEIWFNNQKTLIPIDSSRFRYVILALISNEEMHAENQEHAFTTLFNLFMSLTDEQICPLSQ